MEQTDLLFEVLAETPGAALAVLGLWVTVGRALVRDVQKVRCEVQRIDRKLEDNGIRTIRPDPPNQGK